MLPADVRAAVEAVAKEKGIPPAHLLAIVEVESAGKALTSIEMDGELVDAPLILFEPHVLYRNTSGAVREELVRLKLASKTWNKKLYGRTQADRYNQLFRAVEIAGPVAYAAASYGVGQVLGENWKSLGFEDPEALAKHAGKGVAEQVDLMLRFVEVNNLMDELKDGRWPAFFRGYNGPRWKENNYDTKIAAALRRYGGKAAAPDGMLRMGATGARVAELQALLVRAGYQVKVDRDFGPATDKAVRAFQRAKKIKVDGKVGPLTQAALAEYRQGDEDRPGQKKPREVGGVVSGTTVAIGAPAVTGLAAQGLDEAKATLEPYAGSNQWIDTLLMLLIVAGVIVGIAGGAWAAWAWWQSKQTKEV